MGGASGVAPASVVVLGAGMAGANAAQIAAGMEAEVTVVDRNVDRLRDIDRIWQGRIQTVMSSTLAIERLVLEADLVVGAVLDPGAKAPHLVTAEHGLGDAAGLRARRHLDRPGRLLRDLARHDALRPDVRRRRGRRTTASGTCRAPCPAPRRTPSRTSRCPYVLDIAEAGLERPCAPTRPSRSA